MARINEAALGLTLAVIYGAIMFFIGMVVKATGYGRWAMYTYSSLMPGYRPTIGGSLIGLGWGVLMGAVMGLAVGALYNFIDARLG